MTRKRNKSFSSLFLLNYRIFNCSVFTFEKNLASCRHDSRKKVYRSIRKESQAWSCVRMPNLKSESQVKIADDRQNGLVTVTLCTPH